MYNLHPTTGHKGAKGKQRYTPTLFLTSALDCVSGQHNALATLSLGNTRYPSYRSLCGPQGQWGWVWKISPPLGFNPWNVQPIASCCT